MTSDDPWSPDYWGVHALCRHEGHPSDWDDTLDLPEGHVESEGHRRRRIEKAKAVCARCPVRLACSADTDMRIDSGVRFGIHLEAWREEQQRRMEGFQGSAGRWSA